MRPVTEGVTASDDVARASSGSLAAGQGSLPRRDERSDGARRTAEEVFRHHLELRAAGDVERDIERNYAANAVLLSNHGVFKGHEGVRRSAQLLAEHLRGAEFRYTTVLVHEDIAFLEWTASSDQLTVPDGVDTFAIRDGVIVTQTIQYTVQPSCGALAHRS